MHVCCVRICDCAHVRVNTSGRASKGAYAHALRASDGCLLVCYITPRVYLARGRSAQGEAVSRLARVALAANTRRTQTCARTHSRSPCAHTQVANEEGARVTVLCRSRAQAEAALEVDWLQEIILDFLEVIGLWAIALMPASVCVYSCICCMHAPDLCACCTLVWVMGRHVLTSGCSHSGTGVE